MGWFKIAAIAGGLIIAFLIVGSVVHFILAAVTTIVIAALVVGGIAVAIKMARSGKQVSRKREERQVRDHDDPQPLPRADVEPYSTSVPTQQPRRPGPDHPHQAGKRCPPLDPVLHPRRVGGQRPAEDPGRRVGPVLAEHQVGGQVAGVPAGA